MNTDCCGPNMDPSRPFLQNYNSVHEQFHTICITVNINWVFQRQGFNSLKLDFTDDIQPGKLMRNTACSLLIHQILFSWVGYLLDVQMIWWLFLVFKNRLSFDLCSQNGQTFNNGLSTTQTSILYIVLLQNARIINNSSSWHWIAVGDNIFNTPKLPYRP